MSDTIRFRLVSEAQVNMQLEESRGPQGPAGPQGGQGAPGPAGPTGP